MTKLLHIILNRPVSVLMFYLAVLLIGAISLLNLPVDLLPPIEFPEITVQTRLTNALPEEVEQNVTLPIEESVASITGVKQIRSKSFQGESIVVIKFEWGTNMKYATLDVRDKVDKVRNMLPQNASKPMVLNNDPQAKPIMMLSLSGADPWEMGRFSEYVVKRRLEQIDGVAQAVIIGAPQREIHIEFNPFQLQASGFSPSDVERAIQANNLMISAGDVRKGNFRIALRLNGEFSSLYDIKNLPVRSQHHILKQLQDIATVQDGFKDNESLTRINGKRAIGIDIIKEKGTNTVIISRRINKIIRQLIQEYPRLTFTVVDEQATFIEQAVKSVIQAIIWGGLLAFLVLFFFTSNRFAPVIVAVSIPTSMIIALIILKFRGISLNIMSLAGLAMGAGMLVDNSIIVLENIQRFREKGMELYQAVIQGTRQVGMPILGSTLTTIVVFLPIVFLKDLAAVLFKQQAEAVVYALLASLFVSLTLVPILYYKFSGLGKKSTSIGRSEKNNDSPRWLVRLEAFYIKSFDRIYAKSSLSLSLAAVFFLAAVWVLFLMNRQLLPSTDEKDFSLDATFTPGVSLNYVAQKTGTWETYFSNLPHVKNVYAQCGKKQGVFFNVDDRKLNHSRVFISFNNHSNRIPLSQIVSGIQNAGERIQLKLKKKETTLSQIFGEKDALVTLDVKGYNLQKCEDTADSLLAKIKQIFPGVELSTNFFEKYPEVSLSFNKAKMMACGISVERLSQKLETILKGKPVSQYRDFDKKIDIVLRGKPAWRNNLNSLLNTFIDGYRVSSFLSVKNQDALYYIEHMNQSRLFQIKITPPDGNLTNFIHQIKQMLTQQAFPEGIEVKIGGLWRETQNSLHQLILAFLIAIILVYLLLASQFESLKLPFIIFFTIPLAIVGIVPLMLLTGTSLNLMSAIGFVVISGIVVNDGIIKIEFIHQMRKQNYKLLDAVHEAGKMRLRPIIMTTVTTVVGLLPLAFGIGAGSQLQQPMAIVIIGGISISTLLTLYLLPLLYIALDRQK